LKIGSRNFKSSIFNYEKGDEKMKKLSSLFFVSSLAAVIWGGAAFAYDEVNVVDGGSIIGHVI
jgi:hypothetical protein